MDFKEQKRLAYELAKILIQNNSVNPVSDGNKNLKFEIDGELFSFHDLCAHFYIEIEKFEH
ncbi:MAG: hypothetical protein K0R18_578 [Bacillales bacterium]|jgi:hypothetical protein|nr:hypothetical protein [Bacillales bacterium]